MTAATVGNDDLGHLLRTAQSWLNKRHQVVLATVIETWGSAPRRVGSHLIICDDGRFEGSVSGGCVEGDVISEAAALMTGGCKRLDYGVADETAWQVGLACGGRISILLQHISPDTFDPALIERLLTAQADGHSLTLVTDLSTGHTSETSRYEAGDYRFTYEPPLRLAIIGAVHIAQFLVPICQMLGHSPLVIDPRGLFTAETRFPGRTIDDRWPDEALADWKPNRASAVVALTHDPKLDDLALASALRSPAYYIAALGSRKNHAARLARLGDQGFSQSDLARIHGPAGLDIGAANPAEIALSIASQMTAAWRGKI